PACDDVAADYMPALAAILVSLLQLVGSRERRLLQIEQIDGDAIDVAEGQIVQRRAIDRLNHPMMRLIRPRPARNHDQLVEFLREKLPDLPMVQPRRIKTPTKNADATGHFLASMSGDESKRPSGPV